MGIAIRARASVGNRGAVEVFSNPTLEDFLDTLSNMLAFWPTDDASAALIDNILWDTTTAVTITNADFATWAGGNPSNYNVVGEDGAAIREVTEVGSNEGHGGIGTGACNFYRTTATGSLVVIKLNIANMVGRTYIFTTAITNYISGTLSVYFGTGAVKESYTSGGTKISAQYIANGDDPGFTATGANCDVTVDEWGMDEVGRYDGAGTNLTMQQTGPSGQANAIDFNGTTGRMAYTDQQNINGLTAFSLNTRIKLDSISNGDIVLAKSGEYSLVLNTGGTLTWTVNYDGGTNAITTTSTTLTAGFWYTIGVSINNSDKTGKIFINGLEATYSGAPQAGVGNRISNPNAHYFGDPAGAVGFDGLLHKPFLRAAQNTAQEEAHIASFLA